MERKTRSVRRKTLYAAQMKTAVHLLFYKRRSMPGVKGWELRRRLGHSYPKVLSLLDSYLDKLDLTIRTVFDDYVSPPENPSLDEMDKARFYITLKGSIKPREAKMVGWRIDDLAALAVSLGYIMSKNGKIPRKDLEDFLSSKIPRWRMEMNLSRFIRNGYLIEDETGQIYLGWRARAEVEEKKLIDLLLGTEINPSATIEPQDADE